jgi:hypothetical protein
MQDDKVPIWLGDVFSYRELCVLEFALKHIHQDGVILPYTKSEATISDLIRRLHAAIQELDGSAYDYGNIDGW